MGQARTILERMAALQRQIRRPSLALLAGDFNSVPGSAVHRQGLLGGGSHRLLRLCIIDMCLTVDEIARFLISNSVAPPVPGRRFVAEGTLDCSAEDRRNMSGQLESRGAGWPAKSGSSPAAVRTFPPSGTGCCWGALHCD